MNEKNTGYSDHPVLAYFLLIIFTQVFINLGEYIDLAAGRFIPGYVTEMISNGSTVKTASGFGAAIGALAAAWLFKLRMRTDFNGCLQREGLKEGLLMLLPFLALHWIGSVVSWITFGTGSVLIAFLRAFAPGFGEEFAFRGMGVANYMRTAHSGKQIRTVFWLSSIVFGLVHLANLTAGGDPVAVAIQSVYAVGAGMLLGAVYLRTGNLWPTIIGHFTGDFMELIRRDLSASSGIMTGMGIGDWITIAAAVLAAVLALRLMRPEHWPEILEVWRRKWSRMEGILPDERESDDASTDEDTETGEQGDL